MPVVHRAARSARRRRRARRPAHQPRRRREGAADRVLTFAAERGWRRLRLLSSAGTTYNRDYLGETADGSQQPMLNVFQRDGDTIRHFWGSELLYAPVDPGQEPRLLAAVQGERHRAGCVVAGERGFRGGSGCGGVACDDTVSVSDKGRPSPLPFPEARGGP